MSPISKISDQRSEISNLKSEISDSTRSSVLSPPAIRISLLTGGGDKPYALGMATALTSKGVFVDFIGSDDLNVPEVVDNLGVRFFNLRGDQSPEASFLRKIARVTAYYWRLLR